MKKSSETKASLDEDPLAGDMSEFISKAKWRKVHFNFAPKDSTVTIRLPESLLEAAKKVAKKKGLTYNRMIREAIADYVLKAA